MRAVECKLRDKGRTLGLEWWLLVCRLVDGSKREKEKRRVVDICFLLAS